MLGVLDVDHSPGVLPASYRPALPVLNEDVATDHGEGKDLVTVHVENVDLVVLQLSPTLSRLTLLPVSPSSLMQKVMKLLSVI